MKPTLEAFLKSTKLIDPSVRLCAFVERYGIVSCDFNLYQILSSSNPVIPGETRYACQMCGACCGLSVPLRGIAEVVLDDQGVCSQLDAPFVESDGRIVRKCKLELAGHDKHWFCKVFPFKAVTFSSSHGLSDTILLVDMRCPGTTEGPIISEDDYRWLLDVCKSRGQTRERRNPR